jgi:hypothetical protein
MLCNHIISGLTTWHESYCCTKLASCEAAFVNLHAVIFHVKLVVDFLKSLILFVEVLSSFRGNLSEYVSMAGNEIRINNL